MTWWYVARLESLELRVGSLVHMQVLPVLRRVAAKRVVKVLAFGQVALHFEVLRLDDIGILVIGEEKAAALAVIVKLRVEE